MCVLMIIGHGVADYWTGFMEKIKGNTNANKLFSKLVKGYSLLLQRAKTIVNVCIIKEVVLCLNPSFFINIWIINKVAYIWIIKVVNIWIINKTVNVWIISKAAYIWIINKFLMFK